ncbi:MAG: hypothetical protein ACXW2E_00330 [Nitrososphaeraceae archaeon]
MASSYNLLHTNGDPLVEVYALESNGTNNKSIPRQIIDINFSTTSPYIVVADDVTNRFIDTFSFSIIGDSPYAGNYAVSGTSSTHTLPDGRLVTHIPLVAPLTISGFDVVNVVTGVSGKWVISGPSNGNIQFYESSTFTISGNTAPAANTSYIVSTAETGNQFPVSSVEVGASGKIIIEGDYQYFFQPTTTLRLINTNGFDANYTIASVAINSGNTEVTVSEVIPSGTTVQVGTIVSLFDPNTVITVDGSISITAASNGVAHPSSPEVLEFVVSSPIVVTPTDPHNYLVTFRIKGNHTVELYEHAKFILRNVYYNNTQYTEALSVSSTLYNINTDHTDVTVNIVDNNPTAPVIAISDTSGHQDINFSSNITNTTNTNLNSVTLYTATITVDGVAKAISVLGSTAATFGTLIDQINTDLEGTALATLDSPNSRIRVTSAITGNTSSVAITAGSLFAAPLFNFTNITAGVVGQNLSWLIYPVPAVPYGYIQYTVPTVSSPLQLVGPGCSNYNDTTTWGMALFNNYIRMLEHFNDNTAPDSPIEGQLWYDSSVSRIKARVASSWISLGHRVAAAPVNSAAAGADGDWFADDSWLYVYGATGWRRVALNTF